MVNKQPKYESISEIIDFELEFLSFFRKFWKTERFVTTCFKYTRLSIAIY